tara:strand:+ start:580 stop:975 length:396 start_codon:yes stop_codon:yes gene_type:complete
MSAINFPSNVPDGTTFFHGDNVCLYHAETNTWECRAVVSETPQPSNISLQFAQANYAPLYHHHDAHYAALNHVHAQYATKEYVDQQIAAIPTVTGTVPADVPTRAEFNAMVTTLMAAIANNTNNINTDDSY